MSHRAVPDILIDPPEPVPSVVGRVSADADPFRRAMLDARRELYRGRRAGLGNCWLGGLHVTVNDATGEVDISAGTAQVNIPRDAWADVPTADKIVAPNPPTSPLNALDVDGAIRLHIGNKTLPGISDDPDVWTLVILKFDASEPDLVALDTFEGPPFDGAESLLSSGIPLALVVPTGSDPWATARDCRPTPPWRPRVAYSGVINSTSFAPIVLGTDPGSFYLRAGRGVFFVLDASFHFSTTILRYKDIPKEAISAQARLYRLPRPNDPAGSLPIWFPMLPAIGIGDPVNYSFPTPPFQWRTTWEGGAFHLHAEGLFIPQVWDVVDVPFDVSRGPIAGPGGIAGAYTLPDVFDLAGITLDFSGASLPTSVIWAQLTAHEVGVRKSDIGIDDAPVQPPERAVGG